MKRHGRKRLELFDYSNRVHFAQRCPETVRPRIYTDRHRCPEKNLVVYPCRSVKICGQLFSYAKLFTNSTRLRSAIPDGPLAIHGFCSSIHAVPAMSR